MPHIEAALAAAQEAAPPALMRQPAWALALAAAAALYLVSGALSKAYQILVTMVAMSPTPSAARFSSKIIRSFALEGEAFYSADGCDKETVERRKSGLERLAAEFRTKFASSIAASSSLLNGISDLRFTDSSRVPFPFQKQIRKMLPLGSLASSTSGPRITDVDGNEVLDVSGSYGVNVVGVDRFREFVDRGLAKTRQLGLVLGPLHPVVGECLKPLKEISGLEEISFHMSGTEAVMCAVRLACFNKRRKYVVVFGGAYHGWWDGVQPSVGNERTYTDIITLKDMKPASLRAIKARAHEIACVLVNPVQGFNPNMPPPSDLVMLASNVRASRADDGDRDAYRLWLQALRQTCTDHDVPLIFDEVYSGFRMAVGGGQEYYGVQADMVVYGKSLGGGMPVGVVCGKADLMRRFDPAHPLRVAYVIGTFSAHPLVMGAMSEMLKWVQQPETRAVYDGFNSRFSAWIHETNDVLEAEALPIRVNNLTSVWTIMYTQPGRYNWMLQYYMRSEGINLAWVGTGRLLVSLDFSDADLQDLRKKLVRAASRMQADGWWSTPMSGKQIQRRLGKEILQNLVLKTVRDSILNDILALPANEGEHAVEAVPPKNLQEFYEEIMRRKADDHKASHSNCVNQFLHFLSSSIFMYCYAVFFTSKPSAMAWGLFSLALRQSGHAIFEPPCHDEEELLLGFNTRSKCFVFSAYVLAPMFFVYKFAESYDFWAVLGPVADAWLVVTLFFVLGHTALLWLQYGFRISMVWLIKLLTDPITDITAYYHSCFDVWTTPDWKAGGFSTFMSHWNKEPKAHTA